MTPPLMVRIAAQVVLALLAVLAGTVVPDTPWSEALVAAGPASSTTTVVAKYDHAANLPATAVATVGRPRAGEGSVSDASRPSLALSGGLVAPRAPGVLVEGAGSGTRTINFRPTTDPNWGLTRAHLDKHLLGSGPTSLRQIDPAGNPDLWRNYIQDLAARPATGTLKGGIQDVIGTFPRAGGSGTFQFGIRVAPGPNGTWDLVTLLTRQ